MDDATSLSGPRLFASEVIIAFLLLNEIRHRLIARLFGVSREDANIVTAVAIGSLPTAIHDRVEQVTVRRPSVVDVAIGAAVLKEAVSGLAGDSSKDIPFFGGLVAFAVLGKSFHPILRESLHGARRSVHGVMASARKVGAVLGGRP
jgi:hypothetical protein